MLTVIARQSINIGPDHIAAGKEIATIASKLPVGTLSSLITQPHLVEIDDRASDLDPVDPFDLDLPQFIKSLNDEEAEELLKLLAERVDLGGEEEDESDPVEPLDETAELSAVLAGVDLGVDVLPIFETAGLSTVGELRTYADEAAKGIQTLHGIGKTTADRIREIPGLFV